MEKDERSEYNRNYYANNRERIRLYRKKLYESNKDYRDRIIKGSTISQKFSTLTQGSSLNRYTKVNGQTELLFSLGQLSKIFNRDYTIFIHLSTLFPKQKQGDFHRLYTTSQGKLMNLVRWKLEVKNDRLLKKVFHTFWDKKYDEKEITQYVEENCNTKEKRNGHSKRGHQRIQQESDQRKKSENIFRGTGVCQLSERSDN